MRKGFLKPLEFYLEIIIWKVQTFPLRIGRKWPTFSSFELSKVYMKNSQCCWALPDVKKFAGSFTLPLLRLDRSGGHEFGQGYCRLSLKSDISSSISFIFLCQIFSTSSVTPAQSKWHQESHRLFVLCCFYFRLSCKLLVCYYYLE